VLTALTPLGKVAQGRRLWLASVAAYTAGGLLSSVSVGVLLGLLGTQMHSHLTNVGAISALALVGVWAASRELGRLPLPLPQMHRATHDIWARWWGQPRAALAWGLDIGTFFSTWLTFAGAWWVVALAILGGSPWFGGALLAAYWSGRAATVWLAPLFISNATITPLLLVAWRPLFRRFQTAHACTVLAGVALIASGALG
jgi:hypothetical protein